MRWVRQRTIEPVFGHLLHQYGLRRINVRGLARAQKCMLLAAIGYKLKKLLRYRPAQTMRLAITLSRPLHRHQGLPCGSRVGGNGATPSDS